MWKQKHQKQSSETCQKQRRHGQITGQMDRTKTNRYCLPHFSNGFKTVSTDILQNKQEITAQIKLLCEYIID